MNYQIVFKKIPWDNPVVGMRQKLFIKGNHRIRLVEFSDEFVEEEWCVKGHIGD